MIIKNKKKSQAVNYITKKALNALISPFRMSSSKQPKTITAQQEVQQLQATRKVPWPVPQGKNKQITLEI